MIRTILWFTAAVMLAPVAARAQAPCTLLNPLQIKAVVNTPVDAGQAGGSKDSPDCTWKDPQGQDRVYVSLKSRDNFNVIHAQMQNTGRLSSVTGVGEDAFFVSSTGSAAYLYALGKHHLLLLSVTIPNASRQDNQAAEKAIAGEILPKL